MRRKRDSCHRWFHWSLNIYPRSCLGLARMEEFLDCGKPFKGLAIWSMVMWITLIWWSGFLPVVLLLKRATGCFIFSPSFILTPSSQNTQIFHLLSKSQYPNVNIQIKIYVWCIWLFHFDIGSVHSIIGHLSYSIIPHICMCMFIQFINLISSIWLI